MPERALLLDTHVWIWFANGSDRLAGSDTRAAIETAIDSSAAFLSTISLWETAMLVSKRRITLSMDSLEWMRNGLDKTGIQLLDITPEIAVESANLGEGFHGDPADRIIVAGARIHNFHLVTRDARILAYAREGHCKALPA